MKIMDYLPHIRVWLKADRNAICHTYYNLSEIDSKLIIADVDVIDFTTNLDVKDIEIICVKSVDRKLDFNCGLLTLYLTKKRRLPLKFALVHLIDSIYKRLGLDWVKVFN